MMHKFNTILIFCYVTALWTVHKVASIRRNVKSDADIVPGWLGSDFQPPYHIPGKMKVLDAEARIFLYENFVSDDECDHIINISQNHMSRSGVVDGKSGGSEVSEIRTSAGVFLERGQDEVVKAIEERIAAWTLMPVGNGEGLQVLKYNPSQKYEAHWDYFFHKEGIANGGNRYATVLTYLSDTEEGGETVFPNIPAPGGQNDPSFSECARYNLAAKPKKGTAILFHSIKPSGELERRSLHAACPVIKGVKWSMPKWIHVGHYAMGSETPELIEQSPQAVPKTPSHDGCEDSNDLCDVWAASGECVRNAAFMVGTRARPGTCIQSCNKCEFLKS
ncbi:hypothetical protein CEUSTIGMA_g601.t1 [Chlamydomonas eustigma]|uniref:procollagen-proline 4-dioxygenase n=1 Tax=Chlamydomonas eustigma TaxID=1157962 RepID=A0A250WQP7_9CHLO|nr:hypothetical protein CEUSTIGMA_g601.t1 [Chlamydomonas eustigma]|eukprot:GAX73148.1 hypothetical protein CEUSTIGMA_g601.t1 [Chlamydomonas eustigma]